MDKNDVFWFVLIPIVKEKWFSMYNRSLDYCVHISIPVQLRLDIFATGKHVNHRDKLNETVRHCPKQNVYEFFARNT